MELIWGNEQKALEFLESISQEDRVAVFSHTDVDGVSAGLLMDKFVNARIVEFLSYSPDLVSKVIDKVHTQEITKVIFTDLSLAQNLDDLKKLAWMVPVLVIDHHEFPEDVNDDRLIFLRTNSTTCATKTVYDLFLKLEKGKGIAQKYDWLVAAAVVSDYTTESHQNFLREVEDKYNLIVRAETGNQAFQSDIGKISITINNATIYFHKDCKEFYSLFSSLESIDDLWKFKASYEIIEDEIQKKLKEFEDNAEIKKDTMFCLIHLNYPVTSAISSILAGKYPDKTIIVMLDSGKDILKISSRRQDGKVNLPELLQKATSGLEGAAAGGHFKAAGGAIKREDFDEFKKRLWELV